MARITRKMLMNQLGFICDILDKKIGFQLGNWNLDYAQCYGGYIVVEYMENGGEYHPLLNKRLVAQQMSDALNMALRALEYRED